MQQSPPYNAAAASAIGGQFTRHPTVLCTPGLLLAPPGPRSNSHIHQLPPPQDGFPTDMQLHTSDQGQMPHIFVNHLAISGRVASLVNQTHPPSTGIYVPPPTSTIYSQSMLDQCPAAPLSQNPTRSFQHNDLEVDELDLRHAERRFPNKRCFYQCRFDLDGRPCSKWLIGDRVRISQHLRRYHNVQSAVTGHARCFWENCSNTKAMKRENLARHVVTHLGVKWRCPHCGVEFSRDDAVHRHLEREAPGMGEIPEVVPAHGARALHEL